MIRTKRLAACSLTVALCTVCMLLGALLELGIYAAPMLSSVALIPIGLKYGKKYQLTAWIAASLLCMILVPNAEQNLLFFGLFGWYPAARTAFQKLKKPLRILVKLLLFNVIIIAVEALVMLVLVPEVMGIGLLAAFLLLMNILMFCFDRLLPLMELLAMRLIKYL